MPLVPIFTSSPVNQQTGMVMAAYCVDSLTKVAPSPQRNFLTALISFRKRFAVCASVLLLSTAAYAQTAAPDRNMQRYEVNQTFQGSAFLKDNNTWVYTKEFADLFGMPAKYIEGVQGIAAAAFRIEDTSYQRCGFGGNADACQKVEQCLIDLYFDEDKNPLPWATEIKSQWIPWYSSMKWLRPLSQSERPHGVLAIDPSAGVIRNEVLHSQIIPFADPISKREAIFTTNALTTEGGEDAISGALPIIGYTRRFYRNISVVNLQFGCIDPHRPTVNMRLDAKHDVFDRPIAHFNKIVLPSGFIARILEARKQQNEKNAVFYRGLFTAPLGTKGIKSSTPPNANQ